MRELRDLGIYRLPDGREFVACMSADSNGYLLFTPQAWEDDGNSEYSISAEGRMLSRGFPTRWTVADLRDTGRSAE